MQAHSANIEVYIYISDVILWCEDDDIELLNIELVKIGLNCSAGHKSQRSLPLGWRAIHNDVYPQDLHGIQGVRQLHDRWHGDES